jgi:thiamine biosynthesis lipoprotein
MILTLIIFFSCFNADFSQKDSLRAFQLNGKAQGTSYHCTYYAATPMVSQKEIDVLLTAIDSSLSLYQSHSLIKQFNQHPRGILMDNHMKQVVNKAIDIAALTKGSFDITCKPIIDLWKTHINAHLQPSKKAISNIQRLVGFQHILVKGDSLVKDDPAVQIDCDGIAQGYSVDQMAAIFKGHGIHDFLVELGGEIYASGHPPGKPSWNIAVYTHSEKSMDEIDPTIQLSNAAVTTSGSMSKFMQSGKKIYSHIVHPLKGKPIKQKIIAVTVIANDAITADALDNALMVMGVQPALHWLSNHPIAGANIYYRKGRKKLMQVSNEIFTSYQLH